MELKLVGSGNNSISIFILPHFGNEIKKTFERFVEVVKLVVALIELIKNALADGFRILNVKIDLVLEFRAFVAR